VANLEVSDLFLKKGREAAPFLAKLQPYLGARPNNFSFMVRLILYHNIYIYSLNLQFNVRAAAIISHSSK
jgi:hypothetical protein